MKSAADDREKLRELMLIDTQSENSHITNFFMRLNSGLWKNGQFRSKPAGTYLFIKIQF